MDHILSSGAGHFWQQMQLVFRLNTVLLRKVMETTQIKMDTIMTSLKLREELGTRPSKGLHHALCGT